MFCSTCQQMAKMLQSKATGRLLSCSETFVMHCCQLPSILLNKKTPYSYASTLVCLLHPSNLHAREICLCSLGIQQQTCRAHSNARATKRHFKVILCIDAFVFLTSPHQSECTFGDCVGHQTGHFSLCVFRIHSAGSAEFRLHRLLAYLTALLSSLISPLNADLQLIENELASVSLQCLL